jgi:FHA domain-containing protein
VYEISVVSYQGSAPVQPISAVLGQDGGTIGRGPANTLVLADPNRFVSRVQANVAFDGSRMTIANASTANPLLVNDRELEAGARTTLEDGDEVRVGLYLLRIRRLESPGSTAATGPPSPTELSDVSPSASPAAPVDTARKRLERPAPPGPASLAAVDPLQLQLGEEGVDPFADLLPDRPVAHSPANDADTYRSTPAEPSGPLRDGAINVPERHRRAPEAAPPTDAAARIAFGDPLAGERRSAHSIESKPLPSNVAKIPDSVWDDLVGQTPAATGLSPKPVLPDDFDPFAEPGLHSRNAGDPLAEFARSGVALDSLDKLDTPVDKLFGDTPLQPSYAESVIPDPNATAPDPLGARDALDPLTMFERSEPVAEGPVDPGFLRSERDDVPELDAYFRPPAARFDPPVDVATDRSPEPNPTEIIQSPIVLPAPLVHPPATASAAHPPAYPSPVVGDAEQERELPGETERSANSAYVARLLQEFLAGAGIPNASFKEGLTPEMMRKIGTMLAAAVQGTIELIATRALLKREVKAEVTIIAPTRNNPLKFMPDAESALLQMFGNRIPGFMSPVEAMHDAFRDLRAHEVGLIAGMHAALEQVLHRFEPTVK